jgi:hypothetical protein
MAYWHYSQKIVAIALFLDLDSSEAKSNNKEGVIVSVELCLMSESEGY